MGATPSFVALRQKGTLGYLREYRFGAGAAGTSRLQDSAHFYKEMLELVRRELVYPLSWVDPRLKQYLVGVDIPDAGDHFLLHQDRFHVTFELEHGSPERIEIEPPIERIQPEFFSSDEIGRVLDQPDASDHSLVGISKRTIVGEIETHPSEGRLAVRLPNELKRSRHPEMLRQPAAPINICHEVLAVTPDCNELGAFEAANKCPNKEHAEDPRIAHHDLIDRLSQRILCKHAFEAFDIGQFLHLRVRPPVIRMQRRLSPETGALCMAREWRPTLLAAHGAVE